MKRKLILALLMLVFFALIYAQQSQQQDIPSTRQDIKILTSEQEEEIKVEIRKPDDSSLMPRRATDFQHIRRRQIQKKIKESNKMLYNK